MSDFRKLFIIGEKMFCYQCEQSHKGNCHSSIGVCGKDETTAGFQDILVALTKEISFYSHLLLQKGIRDKNRDIFVLEALFTTVTNVNFDSDVIYNMNLAAFDIKEQAKAQYLSVCKEKAIEPETPELLYQFPKPRSISEAYAISDYLNMENKMNESGKANTGLQELIIYGIKGLAAYADHALILNYERNDIYDAIHEALYFVSTTRTNEELLGKSLEVGKLNLEVMELLDTAHTSVFGHPEPTKVNINPVKGKAILISGHDMKDLIELLKQTEGKGINIYTHGEMLPAHGYPELKKYAHLAGNYGGAWQDQHKEFDAFPGAILMTTNCIQKPRQSYQERIFTAGLVRWPGVSHIENYDFSPVIESALNCDGFTEEVEPKYILTGFGHNAVLNVADKVVDAVKTGAIKHFYLIGGCDGAKAGRNYYTDFAMQAPKDTVILTLACGKFRFNKLEFGEIGGLPRMMDMGQCNDAYSAIKVASALAEAFGTDVNGLPLSFILSWYEQKAVAILLTLLYLGVKKIKLGPTLPQFLEPEVLQILIDNYQIAPIGTVEEDLAETLA